MRTGAYHSFPLDFPNVQVVGDDWCVLRDECILVLIVGQGYTQSIEIDAGHEVNAVAFTADGEYLLSGLGWHLRGVQVWRVKTGERVATMKVKSNVFSLAVSNDGRFIAAGSYYGDVLVWDATTYEQVFVDKIGTTACDVDFSPDSTRLVSAEGPDNTATIWDVAARKKVQTLDHGGPDGLAAKYSPRGDRIATATRQSIRVWASDDGRLLLDIKVEVEPWHGLLWFNNHLFVKTEDSKIKQIDASTGSVTVSEWPVPHDRDSRIALPQHGQFIAYSTRDNVTFWDTSTCIQLGVISRSTYEHSIAFSPSGQLLALVQEHKIIIRNLSLVKVRPLVNRVPFLKRTSYTRNRTFILKTLRSMCGKTVSSPMRTRY